jgi:hypothetical protein
MAWPQMNVDLERFGESYQDALRSYLRDLGEEHLHRAYEMGRDAPPDRARRRAAFWPNACRRSK